MGLPPLIRPQVNAFPTLEMAIWFLQLRWVAVAGQLLTVAMVQFGLGISLPLLPLLGLIGVTAGTNGCYGWWLRRVVARELQRTERLPRTQVVPLLMLSDIVVLTGMLYLTAGMANPFALFYFVNIAVAGAIISPAWAWTIWGVSVASVAWLLYQSLPLQALDPASMLGAEGEAGKWSIGNLGLLIAFATCSGVITYFVTVLTGELRRRELELKEAEQDRIRTRQLEGLATLAAGAGHELSTPLSTIAVVAKELSRSLEKQQVSEAVLQDVGLIRSELDRCRQILDRMTSAAGDAAGERLQEIGLGDFVEAILLGLREPQRVEVTVDNRSESGYALLPVQAAAQAIRNLVQNALDASPDATSIQLYAEREATQWKITVADFGIGMPPEVLERIGEPFFTTKEPGRGMGLGLHLTQNVLRRLNGRLEFSSKPGKGTTAVIHLPLLRE